jgi:hypothetical protein
VKIFKFLYSERAGARARRAVMFYRPACDIRENVGQHLCTPERIARDHNETQGGNR